MNGLDELLPIRVLGTDNNSGMVVCGSVEPNEVASVNGQHSPILASRKG
jgi:hypothetical protein